MIPPTEEKLQKIIKTALHDLAPIKYRKLKESGGLPLFLERRAAEIRESQEIAEDRAMWELDRQEEREPDFDKGPALMWRIRQDWSQILSSHLEFQDDPTEE